MQKTTKSNQCFDLPHYVVNRIEPGQPSWRFFVLSIGQGFCFSAVSGDCPASFGSFDDTEFQRGPGFLEPGVAEGLEEAVEKKLGVAFLITGDVLHAPRGKFSEFVPARHGGGFTGRRAGRQGGFQCHQAQRVPLTLAPRCSAVGRALGYHCSGRHLCLP